MADSSLDPLDQQRTNRPRAGQALKNPVKACGVGLIAIGVVALAICVFSFADRQAGAGIAAAVVALLAIAAGLAWLAKEARRLHDLESFLCQRPGFVAAASSHQRGEARDDF